MFSPSLSLELVSVDDGDRPVPIVDLVERRLGTGNTHGWAWRARTGATRGRAGAWVGQGADSVTQPIVPGRCVSLRKGEDGVIPYWGCSCCFQNGNYNFQYFTFATPSWFDVTPGVERNPQNSQVLDDPLDRNLQGEIEEFHRSGGITHQATTVDPQWLSDSLKATFASRNSFASPVKSLSSRSCVARPVSPLETCWSPQAQSAGPPLKTMRATAAPIYPE